MPDDIQKIIADLATVQQIANRPLAENPLLAVVLQQARSLAEISGWAGSAHRLAQQAAVQADVQQAVDAAAEDAAPEREPVDLVPAVNGKRRA